mmetsp:Transcript_57076/g.167097  ORF Transcript_57076/g.167097 Transcript_57076/m.167097 type:complete len:211 (+) Transcript_57076:254-886(+)
MWLSSISAMTARASAAASVREVAPPAPTAPAQCDATLPSSLSMVARSLGSALVSSTKSLRHKMRLRTAATAAVPAKESPGGHMATSPAHCTAHARTAAPSPRPRAPRKAQSAQERRCQPFNHRSRGCAFSATAAAALDARGSASRARCLQSSSSTPRSPVSACSCSTTQATSAATPAPGPFSAARCLGSSKRSTASHRPATSRTSSAASS